MSKISIEGNASGTGTLTIAAPNTNTNYTLTLPENTGTVVTTGGASSLTTSGNLTFTGTGNRITGDFSNATVANRVLFQTSTTNGNTALGVIPNGTATIAGIDLFSNSTDPANSSYASLQSRSTESRFQSAITGTGSYLPMTFYTGGSERMRIDTSGNVGIGTSSPETGFKLSVVGNAFVTNPSGNTVGKVVVDNADNRLVLGSYFETGIGQYSFISSTNNAETGNIPLLFQTGTTERMRIDSSGNLLIGATGGGYRLTVAAGRGGFGGGQNVGTLRNSGGSLGGLECVSASASDAAFMAFHRPGAYASYFGIDTDNYFAVGGWSAGAGLANFKCSALSKASGSFKVDHPLPELTETHHLVHSFVEAPQADNIYRGKVELVNGRAEVNIDQAARMTEGTFVLLNRNVQCFTSNESDWDAVRGSVNGNILTIECQNPQSTATISWLVIGERQDKHMYDTDWTDDEGRVITEPLKAAAQVEGTVPETTDGEQ